MPDPTTGRFADLDAFVEQGGKVARTTRLPTQLVFGSISTRRTASLGLLLGAAALDEAGFEDDEDEGTTR